MYQGMGRPNKISEIGESAWEEIEKAIGNGVPYKFVCDLAGADISTWNRWMLRGREEADQGVNSVYTDFRARVEDAKAGHVRAAMKDMMENPKGHKGHEWVLSRRHPEEFHQGTKVEHSGAIDGDHKVTVFDAEALDRLADVDDLEEDDDDE